MTPLDNRIDEDFVARYYRGEAIVLEGQLEDVDGAVEQLDGLTFFAVIMMPDGDELRRMPAAILHDTSGPYFQAVFDGEVTTELYGQSALRWVLGQYVAGRGNQVIVEGPLILRPGPLARAIDGAQGAAAIAHRFVRRLTTTGRSTVRISNMGPRGLSPWEAEGKTREQYQADLTQLATDAGTDIALEQVGAAITELGETTSQKIAEVDDAIAASATDRAATVKATGDATKATTEAQTVTARAQLVVDASPALLAARDQAVIAAASSRARASGIPGRNLFDKAAITVGQFLAPTGVTQASSTYDVSDFIPVTPGQQYVASSAAGGTPLRFTCYFDANRAVVAGGANAAVAGFTVPAGVAFVRVTVTHNDLASVQLEAGAAASAYEAFTTKTFLDPEAVKPGAITGPMMAERSVTPAKVSFLKPGKNLFSKAAATIGAFLGHDGSAPAASATYDYSDFIAVTPGQAYYGRGSTSGMRFVTYYDAARAFMAGGLSDGGSPGILTFTPPAGVAFVRVTLYHKDLESFQLEAGNAATAYAPYQMVLDGGAVPIGIGNQPAGSFDGQALASESVSTKALAAKAVTPAKVSFLEPGKNLFDKAAATIGYFRGHDNSVVANATYDYSDFIPVVAGQLYQGRGSSGMRFTTFYDANKTFMAGGSSGEVSSFTPPAGVAFVRVTLYHKDLATFQVERADAPTPYEAYGSRFTPDIIGQQPGTAASGWFGKAWASLGDSITAGATWQALVAGALGLTNTNFGAGGTKVSGPAGDANAMCQDTRINAIPATVDLVTMMGGTNDWAQNVALGAEDSTDPTTFNGALNTFAAKAFARWPTKRIALATTPYGEIIDWQSRGGWTSPAKNSLGLTTNDYAEAIRRAARRLNLHLIDVARSAGWGTLNMDAALGSTTDHLHPTNGSLAAKGIAAVHRAGLREIEPI